MHGKVLIAKEHFLCQATTHAEGEGILEKAAVPVHAHQAGDYYWGETLII
jgi:hypothetical protein